MEDEALCCNFIVICIEIVIIVTVFVFVIADAIVVQILYYTQ
jgi:hypothetical protein